MHYNSVARYIKIYEEEGIGGLYRTGYHSKGSDMEAYKKSILEDFRKNPVCSIAHAITRIKKLTGIERKPAQVRAFMRRHGFKYRKLVSIPGKVNPEEQKQFLEQKLNPAIEKAKAGEIELLFCDAAHFTLSAFLHGLVTGRDIFKNLSRTQPNQCTGRRQCRQQGSFNTYQYHLHHGGNSYGVFCSTQREIQS
jgi:transposase